MNKRSKSSSNSKSKNKGKSAELFPGIDRLWGANDNSWLNNNGDSRKGYSNGYRGFRAYDSLKNFNDDIYSGVRVGFVHRWHYDDGIWVEKKVKPDLWEIDYNSYKRRITRAPNNSGAKVGTGYHWYIVAEQKAFKIDANTYSTQMKGLKFKVGHRRPYWKLWDYQFNNGQEIVGKEKELAHKRRILRFLEYVVSELKKELNEQ
ncbi:MAG: hypothetical protein ACTSU2_06820 [Promethearchaeota archaeon]